MSPGTAAAAASSPTDVDEPTAATAATIQPAPTTAPLELTRDPAPSRLVDADGFRFGTYDGPVRDLDLLARWRGPARLLHAPRLKEWQAFQVITPEHFVLGAVYDAKLLGLLQLVVVERATGVLRRWEHKVPTTALHVARGLEGTTSSGTWKGLSVEVRNTVSSGRLQISARSAAADRGTTPMRLELTGRCDPPSGAHLVICHPFPDGTPLYSHKCVMGVSGVIEWGDERIVVDDRSLLILDDHKGHYPSPMQYDWLTGGRVEPDGTRLAFNLTHNQIRDPERYNENAVFVGGEVVRLGAVTFGRPQGVHGPWRVRDRSGAVDVTFEVTARNEQHVGPGSVLADYYGPFGRVGGSITVPDGRRFELDGCFGMGEQKYIRF